MLAVLLAAAFALSSASPAQAAPELPQCGNNIDDDGDGKADYPADSGCPTPTDLSERRQPGQAARDCSDGVDSPGPRDGDTLIDYPNDPGCSSAADNNENNVAPLPACGDGFESDMVPDGKVDYPADPGCIAASDVSELDTDTCSNGVDDDNDGKTDFPLDWGCAVPSFGLDGPDQTDASEGPDLPQCDDGRDNDGDGRIDTDTPRPDPGCTSPSDNDETDPPAPPPACSDRIDNDMDGLIDFPNDRGCVSRLDTDETNAPAATPAPPGAPGGTNPPPGGAGVSPSGSPAAVYPLISPFPVIRLRGKVDRRGVIVTLLRVQAPNGSRVTIYCSGRRCRPRKISQTTVRRFVRARALERRLRPGTTLRIYVTKSGFTGKYTRFRIRKNRSPGRFDGCARSAGARPVACPVT